MYNNGPAGTLTRAGGAVLNPGAGGIRRGIQMARESGNIRKYPELSGYFSCGFLYN